MDMQEKLTRIIEVMTSVTAETTLDVERYEGTPFTGSNVAAQLGEIRAAQCALADGLKLLAEIVSANYLEGS